MVTLSDCISNQFSSLYDNSLSILYFNARSIYPKIDELRSIVVYSSPCVICIVESWLSMILNYHYLIIIYFVVIVIDMMVVYLYTFTNPLIHLYFLLHLV